MATINTVGIAVIFAIIGCCYALFSYTLVQYFRWDDRTNIIVESMYYSLLVVGGFIIAFSGCSIYYGVFKKDYHIALRYYTFLTTIATFLLVVCITRWNINMGRVQYYEVTEFLFFEPVFIMYMVLSWVMTKRLFDKMRITHSLKNKYKTPGEI